MGDLELNKINSTIGDATQSYLYEINVPPGSLIRFRDYQTGIENRLKVGDQFTVHVKDSMLLFKVTGVQPLSIGRAMWKMWKMLIR